MKNLLTFKTAVRAFSIKISKIFFIQLPVKFNDRCYNAHIHRQPWPTKNLFKVMKINNNTQLMCKQLNWKQCTAQLTFTIEKRKTIANAPQNGGKLIFESLHNPQPHKSIHHQSIFFPFFLVSWWRAIRFIYIFDMISMSFSTAFQEIKKHLIILWLNIGWHAFYITNPDTFHLWLTFKRIQTDLNNEKIINEFRDNLKQIR